MPRLYDRWYGSCTDFKCDVNLFLEIIISRVSGLEHLILRWSGFSASKTAMLLLLTISLFKLNSYLTNPVNPVVSSKP